MASEQVTFTAGARQLTGFSRTRIVVSCTDTQILQDTAALFPQRVAVSRNFPQHEFFKSPQRQVETHQSVPCVSMCISTRRCTVSKTIYINCFYYEANDKQFSRMEMQKGLKLVLLTYPPGKHQEKRQNKLCLPPGNKTLSDYFSFIFLYVACVNYITIKRYFAFHGFCSEALTKSIHFPCPD